MELGSITSGATQHRVGRPHLHQPERGADESFVDYRGRRAASQRAASALLRAVRYVDPRSLGKTLSSTDRERARVKAERPVAPQPKFPKERVRKQRSDHFHDEHGAYTLTGAEYTVIGFKAPKTGVHVISAGEDEGEHFYTGRRIWLAGISAQRGY